jgi:hypothetical protein
MKYNEKLLVLYRKIKMASPYFDTNQRYKEAIGNDCLFTIPTVMRGRSHTQPANNLFVGEIKETIKIQDPS